MDGNDGRVGLDDARVGHNWYNSPYNRSMYVRSSHNMLNYGSVDNMAAGIGDRVVGNDRVSHKWSGNDRMVDNWSHYDTGSRSSKGHSQDASEGNLNI